MICDMKYIQDKTHLKRNRSRLNWLHEVAILTIFFMFTSAFRIFPRARHLTQLFAQSITRIRVPVMIVSMSHSSAINMRVHWNSRRGAMVNNGAHTDAAFCHKLPLTHREVCHVRYVTRSAKYDFLSRSQTVFKCIKSVAQQWEWSDSYAHLLQYFIRNLYYLVKILRKLDTNHRFAVLFLCAL